MSDPDYQYALELQKRLNNGESDDDIEDIVDIKAPSVAIKHKLQMTTKRSNPRSNLDEEFLNRTQNLVHPLWETLDPTPDVTALFGAFDAKFFQGRLKCVTLEWSKRMYSCAGICYSAKNRFGMSITIRLSEPLLKLRARKDLVETMLHEMIHAYCFVLNIREGNGGHGPQFKKIMQAINKVAGTNITVYHSFHDEVNLYKQHWWRCNGSCQNRSPFFGYVKRTCNRAPGPNDQWWAAHLESCGGTFLKIKEPDPVKKKKNTKTNVDTKNGGDIRKFFNGNTSGGNNTVKKPNIGTFSGIKGPVKANGGGTLLLNPKTKPPITSSIAKAFPPTSYPGLSTDPLNAKIPKTNIGGNLRNVVGFGDLNSAGESSGKSTTSKASEMIGNGYAIGAKNSPTVQNGDVDRNHLRSVWSNRFGNANKNQDKCDKPDESEAKRRRVSTELSDNDKKANENWQLIDDDVMLREEPVQVYTLSSDDESEDSDSDGNSSPMPPPPKSKPLTASERQDAIKQEILDETANLEDDDIILIDDEYDDNFVDDNMPATTALADTSIIDEFFGEDTLLKDFILENDVRPTFSRHIANPEDDIVTCPVCQNKLKRLDLEEHLNGCTGIAVKILPPKHALKKLSATSREIKPSRKSRPSKRDILRAAGYNENDLADIALDSSTEDELNLTGFGNSTSSPIVDTVDLNDSLRTDRMRSVYKTTRQCPVCAQEIEESIMNDHLDLCLSG